MITAEELRNRNPKLEDRKKALKENFGKVLEQKIPEYGMYSFRGGRGASYHNPDGSTSYDNKKGGTCPTDLEVSYLVEEATKAGYKVTSRINSHGVRFYDVTI